MSTPQVTHHDHAANLGRAVVSPPTPHSIDQAAAWQAERALHHYDRRDSSPEQLTARSLTLILGHITTAICHE